MTDGTDPGLRLFGKIIAGVSALIIAVVHVGGLHGDVADTVFVISLFVLAYASLS